MCRYCKSNHNYAEHKINNFRGCNCILFVDNDHKTLLKDNQSGLLYANIVKMLGSSPVLQMMLKQGHSAKGK